MGRDGLFEDLPEVDKPERPLSGQGEARVLRPERRQIAMRAVDLDGFLPADHRARLVWAWVEAQDISELYAAIKARGQVAGRAAIDPAILLALWLYALIEGVGSARQIERLVEHDLAYMWLAGDVGVNHHALSDFRVGHEGLVDRLLTRSIVALEAQGLVTLETLAVDGVRVRAHAGQASFRRRETLDELERKASARVAELKGRLGDSPAVDKRREAATLRAARERSERIAKAQRELAEREAERERRNRSNNKKTKGQGPVRTSTSDAEARVMKMPDGGFRPAYNVQVITDPVSGFIVATAIDTTGSDRGLLVKALDRIKLHYAKVPKVVLADGGFYATTDIEWVHNHDPGITAYVPLTASKHGTDPYAARKDDGPGVAALRERMQSEDGKAVYKQRSPAELPHARLRTYGLRQFTLRTAAKALIQATWAALASNLIISFGINKRKTCTTT